MQPAGVGMSVKLSEQTQKQPSAGDALHQPQYINAGPLSNETTCGNPTCAATHTTYTIQRLRKRDFLGKTGLHHFTFPRCYLDKPRGRFLFPNS